MKFWVIDDNPDHRELVMARVRKAYPDASFIEIIRQSMLDEMLARDEVDLVLTDYRLQWSDGLKVLAQVRARLPEVPVLMVTDTGSEEVAAEGMKGGLSDYVLKGHLHRLPLAVKETLEKSKLRCEREHAERQLRVSEERYRTVSELCSDYAYSYRIGRDGEPQLEWITSAFTRITGYSEEELEAGVLLPFVHPEDRPAIERGREVLLSGQPFAAEFRIVTKDGRVRWLRDSARPLWDAVGGHTACIYGAGQDITDRKQSEERRVQLIAEQAARAEAESSERRYRSLAEAIPQMIWTARPDGSFDYFNQQWSDYTGMDARSGSEQTAWSVVHPEDREATRQRWRQAVESGGVFDVECRLRRASDSSYRWHLARAIPLRDPDGSVTKWFGTCTDIDDQKRNHEAMREAQKLESIGLLAGGVAHDFNNLLTGILGNASLVLDDLEATSRLRPLVENVMLASERAADLTRQLLAYSGKGRMFVKPTDVSVLVREISSLIQSSIPKKVDLRLDLAADLPPVDADPAQIQQLVMNLVINGAEAIGEEATGTVAVSTCVRHLDEAAIACNHFASNTLTPGAYVTICVRDNGTGMDESVRPHIFDPFFTTKFTGRGLGLAAALGIVRGHKGAIRLETAPQQGSLFEVLLPMATDGGMAPVKAPSARRELHGSGSVLIIDDEDVVRSAAKATLERYGYTVLTACNGRDGVELFRRERAAISLVLLDMMMPLMGGEEALQEIHDLQSSVPVIGSSGYSESTAKERFGERRLSAFLQKPYTAEQLADCVKEVLERRITGRAG